MKKTFLLFLFFFIFFHLIYAQDTIILRTGDIIVSKITKIKITETGENEIKYKDFINLNGPNNILNSHKVAGIKYQNGQMAIYDSSSLKKYFKNIKTRLLKNDSLAKISMKPKINYDSIQKAKEEKLLDSLQKATKKENKKRLKSENNNGDQNMPYNNFKILLSSSIKENDIGSTQKNINNTTISKNDTTNLEIKLRCGLFSNKSNSLMIGVGLYYSNGKSTEITVNGSNTLIVNSNILYPFIFARLSPFQKNKFFLDCDIVPGTFCLLGKSNEKINGKTQNNNSAKLRLFEAGVTPGYTFSFKKDKNTHFHIEVKYGWLGYTTMKTITTAGIIRKNRTDDLDISLKPDTFVLGITYNFIKK